MFSRTSPAYLLASLFKNPFSPTSTSARPGVVEAANASRRWSAQTWRLAASPLLLFFLGPILALLANTTLARLLSSFSNTQMIQAVLISLRTTLFSLVITILFGTPLAYLMGRHQFRSVKLERKTWPS